MAQKIQVRRGIDSARQSIVFDMGEPVYTTDTKQFYIGDGITAGGVAAGNSFTSSGCILVQGGNSPIVNGSGLLNALRTAKVATPNGKPLASGNRVMILLPPGTYDIQTVPLEFGTPYVSLVGLGRQENTVIIGRYNPGGFGGYVASVDTGHIVLSNLTLQASVPTISAAALWSASGANNCVFENLILKTSGTFGQISSIPETVLMGGIQQNHVFKNITCYGTFLGGSNEVPLDFRDTSFENSTFYGHYCFGLGNTSASALNIQVNNCKIIGNSGFSQNGATYFNCNEFSIINNCYFSGIDHFRIVSGVSSVSFLGTVKNTIIDGNVVDFMGKMIDCKIKSIGKDIYPINLKNSCSFIGYSNLIPTFSNCYVISTAASGCVTGGGIFTGFDFSNGTKILSSGLFVGCKFNRFVSTGVTGAMGSALANSNIVDARFGLYS